MGIMKEQQLNPDDQFLKSVFQQSAILPDPSLKEQIMMSIETKPAFEYEPVISPKLWWVITTVFMSTIGFLLFFYRGNSGQPYFDLKLPTIDFSRLESWTNDLTKVFEGFSIRLPEVSFVAVAALSAILLVGVSFVISYRNQVVHSDH